MAQLVTASQFNRTNPVQQFFDARDQRQRFDIGAEQLSQLQGATAQNQQFQQLSGVGFGAVPTATTGGPSQGQPSATPQAGLTQDQALLKMARLFPERFEETRAALGLVTQDKLDRAANFAFRLSRTPFDQRGALIDEREADLLARGDLPGDTAELRGMTEEEQNTVAKTIQLLALDPKDRKGFLESAANPQVQSSEILEDGSIVMTMKNGDTRYVDSQNRPLTGKARADAVLAARRLGVENQGARARARTQAVSTTKREQGFIDRGVVAADATANIRRSLELLGDVETGGIDAVSLRAKQAFGVEGADEAELSANLGTAVLSQLREIFGAAFTVGEVERLERLSAGFSKSTAGNIRILKQALKMAERATDRGVATAERVGDFETADTIREALEFSLTPEPPKPPGQPEVAPRPVAAVAQEGQIMIDAQGNKARVFPDGRIEEL